MLSRRRLTAARPLTRALQPARSTRSFSRIPALRAPEEVVDTDPGMVRLPATDRREQYLEAKLSAERGLH